MFIQPIASGSSGNCMYVELADTKFLIDVGVSFGHIAAVLQETDRYFEDIESFLSKVLKLFSKDSQSSR